MITGLGNGLVDKGPLFAADHPRSPGQCSGADGADDVVHTDTWLPMGRFANGEPQLLDFSTGM
jgi:hypothetical protein